MIMDVKRLLGREVLITRESGETEIVDGFHPYVYAVPGHELPLGRTVDEASKRVFWTGKKVKTEKIELDHPNQVSEVKRRTKTPLFEFDIDYLLRFCLDCTHSEPPKTLEGITYDIETSENDFRTGAYARGQIKYGDGFEMNFEKPVSTDDPSELAEILNHSEFVIAHNALWFDNEIMGGYGLETHVQRMANPLTGGRLEKAHLVKNSLNLDTIQLADRFLARPPSLSLKLLAPYLGVGEPKIVSPSMIDRVDSRKLREYNRRDVELTCGLADRLVPQLWTVWNALKIPPTVYLRFYGSGTYETSAVLFYRRSGDRYYLPAKERNVKYEGEHANPHARKYRPYKIVGPRIITPREAGSENATVENVWEADYSSLFPNIAVNESISPETASQFSLGDGVLLEHKKTGEQKEVGMIIEDGGFFPAILSELIDLTKKYKKRAKEDPSYEPLYSVTGDTPIITRQNHSGKIDISPIAEIYEGRWDGLEVLTEGGFSPVREVITHRISEPIYRITTREGFVKCTGGHSVISKGHNVKVSDLSEGDCIDIVDLDLSSTEKIDRDVAWLYGFFVAEGFCMEKEYDYGIANTDKELLHKAKKIFEKKLRIKCREIKDYPSKPGYYYLYIRKPSKTVRFWKENFYTKGRSKKVPPLIFEADKEATESFLQGYYDGDGSKHPSSAQVKFTSKSEVLLAGISLLERDLGNEFRVGGSYGGGYGGERKYIYAYIMPKENFEKISKHEKAYDKIERLKRDYDFRRNKEIAEARRLKEEGHSYTQIAKKLGRSRTYWWRRLSDKSQSPSPRNLGYKRLSRELGINEHTVAGWLYEGRNPQERKSLKEGEITKIEKHNFSGYVYDIETGNHHFVGGVGNLLLHNTTAKGVLRNAFTHGAVMSSRRPSGCRFINILAGAKIFTRARELTDAAIETAERAGAKIHSADTDGMYFSGVNGDEIARLVKKETGYDIDAVRYPIGHFCAGKVYALLRKDGTLKVKGASLHGRNIPAVSTEAFQAALKDCMKVKDVNRKKIECGIDEFLAEDHALGKYAFRISLRPPSKYKSEHRKKAAEYFARKWGMPAGVSFDAVVIRGGARLTEKPWATADERQWGKIVPLESYSDQELDRNWYRMKAMGILDRFLPAQNEEDEQASLADYVP